MQVITAPAVCTGLAVQQKCQTESLSVTRCFQAVTTLFCHYFSAYLWCSYYVTGIIPDVGVVALNKTKTLPSQSL